MATTLTGKSDNSTSMCVRIQPLSGLLTEVDSFLLEVEVLFLHVRREEELLPLFYKGLPGKAHCQGTWKRKGNAETPVWLFFLAPVLCSS